MNEVKKIILLIAIVGVIILLLISGITNINRKAMPKKATLFINGYPLLNNEVMICGDHAEMPLVETLLHFDCSVAWDSKETATLEYGGKTLQLSLVNKSLRDLDTGNNLLKMAPGGKYFCCDAIEKDIVVDETTLRHVLRFLGIDNSLHIDCEQAAIYMERTGIQEDGSVS